MMARIALYCSLCLLLAGCSNRQIYESVQADQRRKCQLLPETQIEECLQRHSQTYREYLREKRAIEAQSQ